ncbi:MAG: sulfite exporter TauE/SafE family protein [Gemmatimonadota bacterium]
MIPSLTAAALAGLVGSPHCMGMCGGFAVACGSGMDRGAAWHLGRLFTYMGLGAMAGAAGAAIPGPGWIAALVSTGLLVWFALALGGVVREPRFRIPGLTRLATRSAGRTGFGGRLLFGMANGLLPCGLVYAALAVPVATGDPVVGALSMLAFGLGTVPALVAMTMGLRTVLLRDIRLRRVFAVGVLLAGLASIGLRQGLLGSMHHAPAQPDSEVESVHVTHG